VQGPGFNPQYDKTNKQKNLEWPLLVSENVTFGVKDTFKYNEGHFIVITGLAYQKSTIILNLYSATDRASKYMKHYS
jgi:hypothetical protein